jgi:peroxiredoxin
VTSTVHEPFASDRLDTGSRGNENGGRLSNAQLAAERLLGAPIPQVELMSLQGGAIEMSVLTRNAAIVYFYPGLSGGAGAATDAAQARGFRHNYGRLLLRGYHLFGVHAQDPAHQLHLMAEGVEHYLCADPELRFADMMNVPTFLIGPARVYRPLTLVVEGSKVVHAIHPNRVAQSAVQLLVWLDHFRPDGAVEPLT